MHTAPPSSLYDFEILRELELAVAMGHTLLVVCTFVGVGYHALNLPCPVLRWSQQSRVHLRVLRRKGGDSDGESAAHAAGMCLSYLCFNNCGVGKAMKICICPAVSEESPYHSQHRFPLRAVRRVARLVGDNLPTGREEQERHSERETQATSQ